MLQSSKEVAGGLEVNERKCCTIGSGVFFFFFFLCCVYLFHVFDKDSTISSYFTRKNTPAVAYLHVICSLTGDVPFLCDFNHLV